MEIIIPYKTVYIGDATGIDNNPVRDNLTIIQEYKLMMVSIKNVWTLVKKYLSICNIYYQFYVQ